MGCSYHRYWHWIHFNNVSIKHTVSEMVYTNPRFRFATHLRHEKHADPIFSRLSITNIKWFIELDPIAASSRIGINKLSRSVSRTHRVSKIKSSKMSRSRLDTFDRAKNRVYIFY